MWFTQHIVYWHLIVYIRRVLMLVIHVMIESFILLLQYRQFILLAQLFGLLSWFIQLSHSREAKYLDNPYCPRCDPRSLTFSNKARNHDIIGRLIEQRIDNEIYIEKYGNSWYEIKKEKERSKIPISFTIHNNLHHKYNEKYTVSNAVGEVFLFIPSDSLNIIEIKSYYSKRSDEDLEVYAKLS